jgi:NAD(P)-dependent dehydrogenase (short-subunit alcohol dehydrogenase family)
MRNQIFSNKVFIVTGGASGLGRELAKQLAASGASVVLADINEAAAQEVAAEIAQTGGSATAIHVDVTDGKSVQALVDSTAATFRRIDYLFNNAGNAIGGEIRDLSLEAWRRVIETNLFGVIHGVHFAYPIMIRQGAGHVVNTCSVFGMAPVPLNSPYVASKFAVFGISHALAAEARAFGVDVTDGAYASYWGIFAGGTAEPANVDAVKAGRTQVRRPHIIPPDHDGWPRLFKRLSSDNGFTANDVDQMLFTQISKPAIAIAAERCNVPMEKCHTVMEKYGYTGSACIPMALDDAIELGKIKRGDLVVMIASGVGYNQSAAAVRMTF